MEPEINRDQEMWKKANERAGFKMHIIIYVIVIAFLWVLWAFLGYINNIENNSKWPLYPMAGWALAVLLHYLIVFSWKHKLAQKEYEKMMKKNK